VYYVMLPKVKNSLQAQTKIQRKFNVQGIRNGKGPNNSNVWTTTTSTTTNLLTLCVDYRMCDVYNK